MGGKNKTSQRTKNNTRPSSSGRCAEMLINSFGQFNNSLPSIKDFTQIPVAIEASENEVGSEFVLAIKKMNKKDPVTKTKALQEMLELVDKSRVETVTALLPYWTQLYKQLTTDTEHRVREATQMTHGAIVKKCGRDVAPHLKQIIPTWLMAQYDNYAPAATCAQNSLQNAFPEHKLPEVIAFCKCETLVYLSDNLIGDTQFALANKHATPEVLEQRDQRVIMSSLQGFEYFVKHLPEKYLDWLWEEQLVIFESPKLWKIASHKSTQIRSAWFGLIGRQIERFKFKFGDKYGAKLLKILLNNLDERDPVVFVQLWDCFLLLIDNVEGWYEWVGNRDDLRRKLIALLSNGAWGNSEHMSLIIMPILCKMPDHLKDRTFYEEYITAVIKGLDNKPLLASKGQRQSWLTSLGECIRYLTLQQIEDFGLELSTTILREWLEKIYSIKTDYQIRSNLVKHTATVMSSAVKYWLKMSINSDDKDKYDQLVRNFWECLRSTLLHQISKMTIESVEESINLQIDFILTLKSPKVDKKNACITFEKHKNENVSKTRNEPLNYDEKRYKHNLNDLSYTLCSEYLQFASKNELCQPVINVAYPLIQQFNSKELYICMANDFNGVAKDNLLSFYEVVLKKWLCSDSMRSKTVIDIVFNMALFMNEDEQNAMFEGFKQFVPSVLEQCIQKALSYEYWSQKTFRLWLSSSLVKDILTLVCKRLILYADGPAKNLLLMCFTVDNNGGENNALHIVSLISESLMKVNRKTSESDGGLMTEDICASVLAQLLCIPKVISANLLLQLFRLNCERKPKEHLSEETWWELRTCWQDNVSCLEQSERELFYTEAISLLHKKLLNEDSICLNNIENMVQMSTSLIPRFNNENHNPDEENSENLDLNEVLDKCQVILNFDTSENDKVIQLALAYDIIISRLNCPFAKGYKPLEEVLSRSDKVVEDCLYVTVLRRYIMRILFLSKFLEALILRTGSQTTQDEEDDSLKTEWPERVMNDSRTELFYMRLIHDIIVLRSLEYGYKHSQKYKILSENIAEINKQLKDITDLLMPDTIDKYNASLTEKSLKDGFYWSVACHEFRKLTNRTSAGRSKGVEIEQLVSGVGYFHDMQISLENSSDLEEIYKSNMYLALRCFYLAHCVGAGTVKVYLSESDIVKCLDDKFGLLTTIITKYYENNNVMLYDRCIIDCDWSHLTSNIAIMNLLSIAIKHIGYYLDNIHWDYINITLSSMLHSLYQSREYYNTTKVSALCVSVFTLYDAVNEFMSSLRDRFISEQPSDHIGNLPEEWRDIFHSDTNSHLFKFIIHVLDACRKKIITTNEAVILNQIEAISNSLSYKVLPKAERSDELSVERITTLYIGVMGDICSYVVKSACQKFVRSIVKTVVLDDVDLLKRRTEADENSALVMTPPKLSLSSYEQLIDHLYQLVWVNLKDIRAGEESAVIPPFTDIYCLTMSYLMVYEHLIQIIGLSHTDLQFLYTEFFRSSQHVDKLLDCLVRLFPESVIQISEDTTMAVANQTSIASLFTSDECFSGKVESSAARVHNASCFMWLSVWNSGLNCLARGWWGSTSGRLSAKLNRIIMLFVTPVVNREQLQLVQDNMHLFKESQIKIHWTTNEVICEHVIDDKMISLTIKLSSNNPISLAEINSTGPITHTQMINVYLTYQNGRVWQAIKFWLDTVTRRVESSTVCYICYGKLHIETGQLPKKTCRKCKNKFHGECIMKWFRTSGKSNCPLCRGEM